MFFPLLFELRRRIAVILPSPHVATPFSPEECFPFSDRKIDVHSSLFLSLKSRCSCVRRPLAGPHALLSACGSSFNARRFVRFERLSHLYRNRAPSHANTTVACFLLLFFFEVYAGVFYFFFLGWFCLGFQKILLTVFHQSSTNVFVVNDDLYFSFLVLFASRSVIPEAPEFFPVE